MPPPFSGKVYLKYFAVPDLVVGLKRESGETPELPRSGKQERTLRQEALVQP